jgi:protein-S-isoprenylcysteine O-methyltransferase Ste14
MTDVTVELGRSPLTPGGWQSYAPLMALRTVIFSLWGVFWLYWLIAAAGAKQGVRTGRFRAPGLLLLLGFVVTRVSSPAGSAVHSPILQVVGTILFVAGLGLAVWARIYLGRNWGMPMTKKEEPELVTSGPYRYVRHPIYSGLLLGVLGTALATNLYLLIALVIAGAYFLYCATVEERLMSDSFPAAYGQYKAATKMLIPFVL